MPINTGPKKIEEAVTRNVGQILPNKNELKNLMKKKKIRLYLGVDPTGANLHLGHTIALRKLQEFADLGQEVILVIGTGTVLAGDPSQRDIARTRITKKEIKDNMKTWEKQASKILDFKKIKIKYNGDWLLKLKTEDIIEISSHISSKKLFQRDMFQKRLKQGDTVWTHETLYPILQGYDSVAMDVDLEIGGTDQIFNMLIGRELQRKMKNREKFVLTVPMILGTDNKQMSKTSGNCIWLLDSARQMFGKIMSMPDELTINYFETLTNLPITKIKQIARDIKSKKLNPKQAKSILAKEIVTMYHGKSEADKAEKEFNKVFKEKQLPSDIKSVKIKEKKINILDLLVKTKLASSKGEARRTIIQNGVKIDNIVENDWKKTILIKSGMLIQVGKRKFVKIVQ